MEPRVSLITLGVADLARSYRFYKDGLGLPTTRTPDEGIVFFRTQGVAVALYPYAKPAENVGPGWDVPRSKFTGITLAHNVRERHPCGSPEETTGGASRGRSGTLGRPPAAMGGQAYSMAPPVTG
jgi:catechol 2,3-dioxygenase-like lactoylglutathione lyase family enzyme